MLLILKFCNSLASKYGDSPVKGPESMWAGGEASDLRRHSSVTSDVPLPDSNVLRKVASLTLDKATLEQKVHKPKFVPEKLDFQIYEKFEGQMLINWFVSAFGEDHYLRMLLTTQDLRILGAQFCTHLLAAGVLRQIPDRDVPLEALFRPDLMYYWAHSEAMTAAPPTPGKLGTSSWPPISPDVTPLQARPGAKYTEAEVNGCDVFSPPPTPRSLSIPRTSHGDGEEFQQVVMGLKREHKDNLDRLCRTNEVSLFSLRGEQAARICELEERCAQLERELETYHTMADIEALTAKAKADFGSPSEETAPALPGTELQEQKKDGDEDKKPSPSDVMPSPVPPPPPPPPMPDSELSSALAVRKLPVNPKMPMKPLYWTRILIPATTATPQQAAPPVPPVVEVVPPPPPLEGGSAPETTKESAPVESLWEALEEPDIGCWDEFSDLFSRQVIERKPAKKKEAKPTKQVAKLLDSKRSQNVGILVSSLHLEIAEVENAIYNFDTSVISLESLQQIYEVRATKDELEMIRSHVTSLPDIPLDRPEHFLHDLGEIPSFAERIACFMFQADFADGISGIDSKLNNLKSVCEVLLTSENLQTVLGVILALGNYMNGGNRSRGQADGFGLEILPKLRDVKSKDNTLTLLHYVVRVIARKLNAEPTTSSSAVPCPLPIPEPGEVDRATVVRFEDVAAEILKLKEDLEECEKKTEKVIAASTEDHLQPFKDKMQAFLENASKQLADEEENLQECKQKFFATLKFYHFLPRGVDPDSIAPKDFFSAWTPFCSDFKDLWKKEMQRIAKEKLQEAKKAALQKQEELKGEVKKARKSEGGLKSKLLKKRSMQVEPKSPTH